MRTQRVLLVAGAVAVALAAAVPSALLVQFFRGTSPVSTALLTGAHLFRASLAVLGAALLAMARLVHWQPQASASEPWTSRDRWGLASLLAVAFGLRLWRLDAGLWYDEIVTVLTYARLPFPVCIATYVNENQHFLYTLLARASFVLFGEHAWSLRLPAALFGVASVWSLYLLGRRVAGSREGLLAAALLTVSYHHVWFSQSARGYSGLLFWAILASWLLLGAIESGAPRLWVFYAASAALGVWTHLTMVFVVAGHALIFGAMLVAGPEARRQAAWTGILLGFGLATLIGLQLHAFVLPQMRAGIAATVSYVEAWKNPLWTLTEVAAGLRLGFAHAALGAVAAVVFGAGLWSYARSAPAVIGLLLLPALLGGGYVVAVGHHLWPRFFYFAFGFAALVALRGCLVAGEAVARLARLPDSRRAWPGLAACVVLVAASAHTRLEFVEANQRAGDGFAAANLAGWVYRNYYGKPWDFVMTSKELEEVRARSRRTWLVYTLPQVLEGMAPEIARAVKRDFREVRRFPGTLNNGAVYVCLAEGPPAPAPPGA